MWREGEQFKGPTCDPLGRIVKHELHIGRAESLASFLPELHFFTPAIIYKLGIIGDQPLIDYQWELRREVCFFYKKFRMPIFRGLDLPDGDGDWNHVLWAMRSEHWPSFQDFYCSVIVRNYETNQVSQIATQELSIVDPLYLERRGIITGLLPEIAVTAIGVRGNRYQAAFRAHRAGPPSFTFFPPPADVIRYADILAAGLGPFAAGDNGPVA